MPIHLSSRQPHRLRRTRMRPCVVKKFIYFWHSKSHICLFSIDCLCVRICLIATDTQHHQRLHQCCTAVSNIQLDKLRAIENQCLRCVFKYSLKTIANTDLEIIVWFLEKIVQHRPKIREQPVFALSSSSKFIHVYATNSASYIQKQRILCGVWLMMMCDD